ncbi:HAMP domain-containing sensor histidine kinase [Maridesulfovibrio sp.]|uniref:sensor histidine kinase n=1 Tax=Maridesulfovibrio sp. TaxID=2795000 RepID=UPI0029C9F0D4|nr:HAMP domain-containing sensor histidine kinase [Maridesulfovibrio sp.]
MLKLNIRQKIIIGIIIFAICFGCLGLLSYMNTVQLENEVQLIERSDDLSSLILEIRRIEKNYLLYHDPALFTLGLDYLNRTEKLLQELMGAFRKKKIKGHGKRLEKNLVIYKKLLQEIARTADESLKQDNSLSIKLREVGQNLVEHSKAISNFERDNILDINRTLRSNLFISMFGIAAVIMTLVGFFSSHILKPLRQVQQATEDISQGTFKALTIKNSHDEIQQVFAALNSMVEQLLKRRRQLVQAQKLSSIGTLASGIAHQLNNPLNNISTSCQILEERTKGKDELADKMMHNIMQETMRSRDIVKGLLEFSREREYSPGPIEIDKIVQSAVSLVSSQVPSNINLVLNLPENIFVFADRRKLQEAFINLLINAIQAIGTDQGQIEVSLSADKENTTINISDTGPGIPPETQERIFDPFFSTKEVGQGTGLGLYIVYGIIEKHQGNIRVRSNPGQGTKFLITLPLDQEHKA